jgi:hypothetical protein
MGLRLGAANFLTNQFTAAHLFRAVAAIEEVFFELVLFDLGHLIQEIPFGRHRIVCLLMRHGLLAA